MAVLAATAGNKYSVALQLTYLHTNWRQSTKPHTIGSRVNRKQQQKMNDMHPPGFDTYNL